MAEAAELKELIMQTHSRSEEDAATALRRVLAWCLEGGTLAKSGFRVHIAAAKLEIDPVGPSLDQIGRLAGFGRSAANKHAMQFSELFGVRGPHDRSQEAREAYSESWHRRRNRLQPE